MLFPDVEDGKNVGMIERRRRACFLREPLHPVMIGGERRRQDFDRHGSTQSGIARAIDFAHPARTEQRLDLVWSQLRP